MTTRVKVIFFKTIIHLIAFGLLSINYYASITDQNGADPVKAIIHFTGIGALNLLLMSLLFSPIAKQLKQPWLMQCRRLVGLYSFCYTTLHILNFWWFELAFDVSLFLSELAQRPYIWLGLLAFLILLCMAMTSPLFVRRKMGAHWQQLHNWVYLAVILVWIHFYWSRKADIGETIIYITVIAFVLLLRKTKIKKWLALPKV
ncbi:protein-methionine-sulfoxide reductase heme-binding subunit MsrQ [Catenovulum sediminis]|uniref:Protein-methionine-sulfoxide reductase heme-binding subunit MsrQ n=1 Tax=Catenovulum sediminis TaxID=1740262 RepID=A0ABV1RL25_9ALTE